ncbi:MAG: sugar phosphate isomerase/epimerase [Candidatus Methylacidiphilales bacterium]
MKLDQIAIQLYTLRDFCQTAAELAVTLKKVRDIGYTAAQVSGVGPIPPEEIRSIANDAGVHLCATHESGQDIRENPGKVIEQLHKLGVTQTAYPYPVGVDFADSTSVRALIDDLNRSGKIMASEGISLSYHNHAIEFVRLGKTTVLDHIYASTDPEALKAELDTYWVHYGGGDVVRWCERMNGRLPLIHLKDYQFTHANTHAFAEVGAGNLDFARICAAAEASGCQWFIVEQDSCPGDPFQSIRQSFEYIRDHLVRA